MLHNLKGDGLSCGPGAVRIVTGLDAKSVTNAFLKAAAEDGQYPRHLDDTAFKHQARALEIFGYELRNDNEHIVSARSLPMNPQAQTGDTLRLKPSLQEFGGKIDDDQIYFVYAMNLAGIAHTAVFHKRQFGDINVGLIATNDIPAYINQFRVTCFLNVSKSRKLPLGV